ncbi:MAG TPA: efflux RND transporter periplasmic adaptor subunit [Verrucomicrobiales bacterium]|nr:efflux RND transporter periplasmic adaptor subunit [Verrucomicrobiales bacterium]
MLRPKPNEDLAAIVQRGKSRPVRKWLLILAGCVLAGGAAWFLLTKQKAENGEPEYVTEPARIGRISLVVTAAGNLAPINQVIIGSELSGRVDEVYVDTNDSVAKNEPVAKLDTSKLDQQTERSRAAFLESEARVSQSRATLQEARAALARQEELHRLSGGRTPSKATMETSLATVSRAEADLESALASVEGAAADVRSFESDLEKAIIRSPVDGVVLSRSIEVGQTVAASFTAPTLFTIAEDLRKMELLVSVTEADIGRVQAGQTATFTVDAWPGRTYTATVKKVAFGSNNNQTAGSSGGGGSGSGAGGSGVTTGVVTYSTELEVANEDLSLRPGMTATVDIAIVDKDDILVVPNSALRFNPEEAAAIGKPDDDKRTLVESLSPRGGRRWRGNSGSRPGGGGQEPRVYTLIDGEPVEILVTPGITDSRLTEITGGALEPDMPVIVSIKPKSAA